MSELLVRGGTIVDGTGAPARPGDVRVRGGVIVEIGRNLASEGEQVVDAGGTLVTPGLIDPHTHFDGEMFWDPSLDPLPSYGVTTAVMGNCGLGVAPVREDVQDAITDLLCFIEELPFPLFKSNVPWGWRTWSEYHSVASSRPTAATLFAYTGHNALRGFAMGPDAWDRPANDKERGLMVAALEDALTHGSLGLSTNFFDTDRARKLVPSRLADDAEFEALFDVMARFPHSSLQIIARDTNDTRRLLRMAGPRGIRILRSTGGPEDDGHLLQDMIDEGGWDVWRLGGGDAPFAPSLGFDSSIGTAAVMAWHEMVNGPADRKLALLADPDWRARARHDWDNPLPEQNSFKDLDIFVLSDSENGAGPVDLTLEDLAAQRNLHPSDALADWILANGIGSRYHKKRFGLEPEREELKVKTAFADPRAVMGATDAGAHVHMFCGGGGNAYMLTHWSREKGIAVEDAVHCLTGRTAEFFALADRGVIEVGRRGDLAVFALDEIEIKQPKRVHDLPDGGWRFSRPSAGFRATVVAGVPTVLDGKPTGEMPAAVGHARLSSGA